MKPLVKWTMTALLSITALVSQPLMAEQFIVHDNYEIHYNAFNSTFVQPDIAQNVGIQRSKRKALVNVSVLKIDGDKKTPVKATVTGKASNLAEQHQSLDFKKVDEGDAIYYLGQFGFTNGQVFRLSINVQPDPNKAPFNIKFEQKFYED